MHREKSPVGECVVLREVRVRYVTSINRRVAAHNGGRKTYIIVYRFVGLHNYVCLFLTSTELSVFREVN
jgi:hypothetical protein